MGSIDGDMVGETVGDVDGAWLGKNVGWVVGLNVGESVGRAVGIAVGASESKVTVSIAVLPAHPSCAPRYTCTCSCCDNITSIRVPSAGVLESNGKLLHVLENSSSKRTKLINVMSQSVPCVEN